MKTIYLVRHGQAESNLEPDIIQAGDSPLTELGRRQASLIAERAANISFDVMIASPMRRTQETAMAIAQKSGISFESEVLFEERRLPTSIVGKSMSDPDIKAKLDAWERTGVMVGDRVDDGENFDDLYARAAQALRYLEQRPEEKILVVGHGFMTRMIIARVWHGASLTPKEFEPLRWGMRTKNTGLSVLRFDSQDKHGRPWWLDVWNDHTHLG